MTRAQNLQEIFSTLNEKQHEAVANIEGPLLVLAGAGTGKTKVLTTRIVNIILQKLAQPENILAVTFTNKAANEMRERVNNMLNTYNLHSSNLNIGTFHSIATRILRQNIEYFNNGLNRNFSIIDQDEQLKLIKDISVQNGIDISNFKPKIMQSIIARWKDQGLLPHKLSPSDIKNIQQEVAKKIYKEYQKQLIASNVVDFGDLIIYNNELFIEHPKILAHYQNIYRYILIDEYQDTNIVQYLWVRMLSSQYKNICCVGDEDQSIYSWRGAEVGNIKRFSSDFPNTKIIKLEQNYRSSTNIIAVASSIINNNNNRHSKSLWTDNNSGEKVKVVSCYNDKQEAQFVINQISTLIANVNRSPQEMAILVRAGFQTRVFEEALISKLLPYRIIGGIKFYERSEIKDIIAYVRIATNNSDNIALERIINTPKRAIGSVTLKQIKDYAHSNNISLFTAIKFIIAAGGFTPRITTALSNFIDVISSFHGKYLINNSSVSDTTKALIENSGYLQMLKEENTDEARAKIENINEMLNVIAEFNKIEDFLEHASLVASSTSVATEEGGAISVMTFHAAKGLEFPVVFLPGWEEGIFPSQKSLSDINYDHAIEEERRIAYVGITRAKELLYISFAQKRFMFKEFIDSVPSRFIGEIPQELYVKLNGDNFFNKSYTPNNININKKAFNVNLPKEPVNLYKIGQKVTHEQFGNGMIIRTFDIDKLEVLFEKGHIKILRKDFIKTI